MAHSSGTKSKHFNQYVQPTTATRCRKTIYNDMRITKRFFLPDGKNTQLSKIVNTCKETQHRHWRPRTGKRPYK